MIDDEMNESTEEIVDDLGADVATGEILEDPDETITTATSAAAEDGQEDDVDDALLPDDLLGQLTNAALRAAVKREIAAGVKTVVTEERALAIRGRAQAAALASLDTKPAQPAPVAGETDPAPEDEDEQKKRPELTYGSVNHFFRDHLRHLYRRRVDGSTVFWVADWWRYPEAVDVLEGVWRAWEFLTLDGRTGLSVWWRDHARPHMGSLMSKESTPFPPEKVVEDADKTKVTDPLPHREPPAGLFPDERGPLAVTRTILRLLGDPAAPDQEQRLAGYLAVDASVTVAQLTGRPLPDHEPPELRNAEDLAAIVTAKTPAGVVSIRLTRRDAASPWLAHYIHIPTLK